MQEGFHRLMFGLLYPAVLGTVFVIFISDDLVNLRFYPRTAFGILFLIHGVGNLYLQPRKNRKRIIPIGNLLVISLLFSLCI